MPKRLRKRNDTIVTTENNVSSIAVVPKVGRKSSYDSIYCDIIVNRMKEEGISLSEFAREIGVHPNTLLNWRKTIPEFNIACEMAIEFARGWWEELGRKLVVEDRDPESPTYNGKKKINTILYLRIMENRFGWAAKTENKQKMSMDFDEMGENEKKSEDIKEISEEERARKIISILDGAGYIKQRAAIAAETKTE